MTLLFKIFKILTFAVLMALPAQLPAQNTTTTSTTTTSATTAVTKKNYAHVIGTGIQQDLTNLQSLTSNLTFDHWSETIIPGNAKKGRVLFQWLMYVLVFPVFAILLIWDCISQLQDNGTIKYVDTLKRIFTFVIFTSFSTAIFAYLAGIQSGMSGIVNFILNHDIGNISELLYNEDALQSNRMKEFANEAKEDVRSQLMSAARGQAKYKNYKDGETLAPMAAYMVFPIASYNEGLALQDSGRCKLPGESGAITHSSAKDMVADDLKHLASDAKIRTQILAQYAAQYAQMMNSYASYPSAAWRGSNQSERASANSAYKRLYLPNTKEDPIIVGSFSRPKDSPLPEYIYDALGAGATQSRFEATAAFYKAQVELFINSPVMQRDIDLLIWRTYHGDDNDVVKLTAVELSQKMQEVRKGKNGEILTLSNSQLESIKPAIVQLYLQRLNNLGVFVSAKDSDEALTPDAWCKKVGKFSTEPGWFSSACSWLGGKIASVVNFVPKLIGDMLTQCAVWIQQFIVWLMFTIMAIILSLQFLITTITSCMLGSEKTKQTFFTNFRICLQIALIPFTCSLLLGIFNMLMNSFYASLSGATAVGVGTGVATGAATAGAVGAGFATGAVYATIFIALFQIVGLIFLALYSIKASSLLLKGGTIAGAVGSMAGAAIAAGAATAKLASGGAPGASSMIDKGTGMAKKSADAVSEAGGDGTPDAYVPDVAKLTGKNGKDKGDNDAKEHGEDGKAPKPPNSGGKSPEGGNVGASDASGETGNLGNAGKGTNSGGNTNATGEDPGALSNAAGGMGNAASGANAGENANASGEAGADHATADPVKASMYSQVKQWGSQKIAGAYTGTKQWGSKKYTAAKQKASQKFADAKNSLHVKHPRLYATGSGVYNTGKHVAQEVYASGKDVASDVYSAGKYIANTTTANILKNNIKGVYNNSNLGKGLAEFRRSRDYRKSNEDKTQA